MMSGGYKPDKLIMTLPRYKLICVAISKVALARFQRNLARFADRFLRSPRPSNPPNNRRPFGPRAVGIGSFHELATSETHHDDWPTYYTRNVVDRIFRAFERTLGRFGYPQALMPSVGRNQTSTRKSLERRAKMRRSNSTCSTRFATQAVISIAVRSPDQINSMQVSPNLLNLFSDALRTLG